MGQQTEDTLRVFTAFSGYDSQCLALSRLSIPYDLVGWSEIDPFAIRAHNALFPQWEGRNYGDIAAIDWAGVPDFDLFTYSFPCTDISVAGRQRGLTEGSGTASSLLWECRRAIEAKRPRYLLMENVKALLSRKFRPLFGEWERTVARMGYTNFVKVLNARDYGVPQNRERVFMVSILGDASYHFPAPFPLDKRLADVLEQDVPQKYFLSERLINGFIQHDIKHRGRGNGFRFEPKTGADIANTVTTKAGTSICDNYVIQAAACLQRIAESYTRKSCLVDVWSDCTICPRRTDRDTPIQRLITYYDGSIVGTIDTGNSHNVYGEKTGFSIRRLTPRECLRLMGVADADIDRIQRAGISDTQQYKMAGNSIVVDVLCHIFRKLFIDKENEKQQQTLF